ncbi:MAG: RNA polymerase sigma factor [Cyclobacteriaceae bacterium]
MKYRKDSYYIKKVLQGQVQYYAPLVEKHKLMAFNLALRIVKHREDAEEVAQDAFVKVYESLPKFRAEAKFSTWLYKIIYHEALGRLRKKKIETSPIEFNEDNQDLVTTNEYLGQVKNETRQRFIEKAVHMLEEDEQWILNLFYYSETPIKEIVEITGYTESNVKIKLFRARKQLQVNLQGLLKEELIDLL